eukprot:TRINITY_DN62264_c1_g1_i1.p1 TRINITY_DN62264_c1_g1~~TRINITY_DN62264_c1_g1_i1.p1  ORF type:complete len:377 (+),score=17.74 TRINITY_DN62264_c1_g1_i1:55-1185(+)
MPRALERTKTTEIPRTRSTSRGKCLQPAPPHTSVVRRRSRSVAAATAKRSRSVESNHAPPVGPPPLKDVLDCEIEMDWKPVTPCEAYFCDIALFDRQQGKDGCWYWTVRIVGPEGSPYDKAEWLVEVSIPSNYPSWPPGVQIISPTPLVHSWVAPTGQVRLPLLDKGWWRYGHNNRISTIVRGLHEALSSSLGLGGSSSAVQQCVRQATPTHAKQRRRIKRRLRTFLLCLRRSNKPNSAKRSSTPPATHCTSRRRSYTSTGTRNHSRPKPTSTRQKQAMEDCTNQSRSQKTTHSQNCTTQTSPLQTAAKKRYAEFPSEQGRPPRTPMPVPLVLPVTPTPRKASCKLCVPNDLLYYSIAPFLLPDLTAVPDKVYVLQ